MSESHQCSGNCSSCSSKEKEECQLNETLSRIKHKIVVMSGKGGVGKSTVSVNLAHYLAKAGYKVGLLDVDVHGPSVPKMLNIENARPESDTEELTPVTVGNLSVMSLGFLLEHTDDPVIWRGPMKIGVIKQMLGEVKWGDLDYLVIDCPPGTGDEPLTVCQTLTDGNALIVTTPQQVAAVDVSKSVNFCKLLNYKILGVVENMSGFVCPHCGKITEIFSSGAGETLAKQYQIPFLGKLPIDPSVCVGGDDGNPFAEQSGATAEAFQQIAKIVVDMVKLK